MRGNTNANISGGGSSKEIKILNVVQNGTLYRDGAVFSGFSSSNYLRCGARVDKGILSLDSSTYVKNFTPILTADNWKIKSKIYHKLDTTQSSNAQALLSIGNSWLLVGNTIAFYLQQNNTQLMTLTLEGADTYYNSILQVELIYSNVNGYTLNLYDDNNVLLLTDSNSLTTNIFSSDIRLGVGVSSRYLFDDLYINDCSIEINNEIVWKGVETLTI